MNQWPLSSWSRRGMGPGKVLYRCSDSPVGALGYKLQCEGQEKREYQGVERNRKNGDKPAGSQQIWLPLDLEMKLFIPAHRQSLLLFWLHLYRHCGCVKLQTPSHPVWQDAPTSHETKSNPEEKKWSSCFFPASPVQALWAMGRVKGNWQSTSFCKSETPFLTSQYNLIQQMLVEVSDYHNYH